MGFDSKAEDIISRGWALLRLEPQAELLLHNVLKEAALFFELEHRLKSRFRSGDGNHGFRQLGIEYSITPDHPDLNESFSIWSSDLSRIPEVDQIEAFCQSLLAWRGVVAAITRALLSLVAERFGSTPPGFEAAATLQVNNYTTAPAEREFLQEKHEDGHMVTLQHATGPGLEVFVDSEPTPIETGQNELLVMSGSALTALSGGAIPPTYHQVRNLGLQQRQSIMYFVNPELNSPLFDWTGKNPEDLRIAIRDHPAQFGLPPVPEL